MHMSKPVNTVVTTKYGQVRGSVADGVSIFKGISYAAPPFGANRFRPPQPVEPWSGVRDAIIYGPTPPHLEFLPPADKLLPDSVIEGKDCLNLNIWSPDLGSVGLPVMIWIPGGAFTNGSNALSWYDGSHFARDGVVCVSINYRLGIEGFLYLGDGIANLGLLDQIAALSWVQENIAAFGGDPNNVTIFGQSAGGMSVATLLSMPRAEGLFRRAIAQSGAGHHVTSAAPAQWIGQHLAELLGVKATREEIAAADPKRLLQVQQQVSGEAFLQVFPTDFTHPDPQHWGEVAFNGLAFEPLIDGEILSARPIDRLRDGASAGVDVMVGTNAEELRLFMVPPLPAIGNKSVIDIITDQRLAERLADYKLPVEATLATYRAARSNASAGELFVAIQNDWFYRIPAIRLAEAHAKSPSATYMYEFAWRSPQYSGRLGACHALEIAFVFDNLDDETFEPLLGTNPPQLVADAMHAAWVAFATHGDPGWPKYDLSRRATMRLDTTSEVVDDPRSAERALWDGLR
jgi:carboxylesterase type B